ncbi:beta-glucosidase [Chromatiales bacterium (ex Bugula neritina AB1)]|nr:beta-glucosidase [Chromatiales bacterium (ex Bugula neritina AB1)]
MNKSSVPHPGPFPEDFLFGVATASYQIEGAHNSDGRKPSIWDTFSRTPGKVHNGDTGDIACDHYHLWESDLDLIKSMHMDAYRFSIAWPRVIPDGTGSLNSKGLAFYDRLVDGCLERGLKPFATLYHWDLPMSIQDRGGWTHASTALAFAEYAQQITRHLGDRLASISTFNEPWCSSILGYLFGIHAPGETSMDATLASVHYQHLGHGLAVQAIRAENAQLDTGIVLNVHSVYPATNNTEDADAAARGHDFHNQIFLDPLFKGHYPEEFLNELGDRLPASWQDDLPTIHQPLDFWGLNYYTPMRVLADPASEYPAITRAPIPDNTPVTDIGWEVAAETFSDILIKLYDEYDLPPCYITENGACYNDEPVDGVITDSRRIEYFAAHLDALARVIDNGLEIKGYFAWSLMDNFEWAEGYRMRFGLVHVDYNTQVRTIKDSGHWYSGLALSHSEGHHQ